MRPYLLFLPHADDARDPKGAQAQRHGCSYFQLYLSILCEIVRLRTHLAVNRNILRLRILSCHN